MNAIIFYGDKNDDKIKNAIVRALSNYNKLNSISLYEYEDIADSVNILNKSGIFVFKNSSSDKQVIIPKGFIAVFSDINLDAISKLEKLDIPAVSCGMSSKDTISVSSIDDYSVMISIQREILLFSGEKIEPHDFCVFLKEKLDIYPLLVASLTLILSDVSTQDKYLF